MDLSIILEHINLDNVADVTGIISFAISIPTLILAKGTRKAIKEHDDAKEYQIEIDTHIKDLENLSTSIEKDDVYNVQLLRSLQKILDTINIQYSSVVKPFKRKISKLLKCISQALQLVEHNPNYNKAKVIRLLEQVIQHLKKVKKSL